MLKKIARRIRKAIRGIQQYLFGNSTTKAVRLMYEYPGSNIDKKVIFEECFSFDNNSYHFKLNIESGVHLKRYCHILIYSNASLLIKSNTFFNNYCSINCLEKIEIGENTMFGEGVKIYDHNHDFDTQPQLKVYRNKFTTAPVIIGNNCWIGSNVTILKGVTIGDNSIIGANCLIYKTIPPNSIVKSKQDLIIENF